MRAYTSKHLSAMHAAYGVHDEMHCDSCRYLVKARCTQAILRKRAQWNRTWQGCGRWVAQDVGLNGYEWVEMENDWRLRAVRNGNGGKG